MIDLEQSEIVADLSRWLIAMLQPGPTWRGAWAQFKPVEDRIWVNVHSEEEQGNNDFAGDLKADSAAPALVRRLQDACAAPGTGSWLVALLEVRPEAGGNAIPRARFNYDHDPGSIAGDDGEFTGEQLVAHLQRYPRSREHVPEWMAQRIESAGLQLP